MDRRAIGQQGDIEQPRIGFGVLAEGDDAFDAGRAGMPLQPREMRIVAIDHGGAARLDAAEDLGLGVGDLLDRAEEFQVHRLDRGDDRRMRARQPAQRLDLAAVIHSHLEHGIARILGTARQRERHAPMIVVGGVRGMRRAAGGERQPQRLLGAGLADRAGHADHLGRRAGARGAGEIAKRGQDIGHDQQRGARKGLASRRRHHRQGGARLQCGRHEVMAVAVIAGDGEKGLAGRNAAAVDRQARHRAGQRPGALGSHGRSHGVDGPERALAHDTLRASAAATAP
jgi:hypothetical protein